MMRAAEFAVLLVRLGLVLGLVMVGIVLLEEFRPPATTKAASTPSSSPVVAASIPSSSPAVPPTNDIVSNVPRADENAPRVDRALVEAATMTIAAPPETELALQGTDPRRLRANFQRGTAAMQRYVDDELKGDGSQDKQKIEGARLVNIAAILGYEPARVLIARDYPRSHIIRSALSAEEAVRYSLDPLFTSGTPSEGDRALTLLAAYFSGRHELGDFAAYIVQSLRDDRRLQTEDRINFLINQLAHVRGACTAISRAISPTQISTGGDCPPALQQQMLLFVHVAGSAGRDAESRRQALSMLHSQQGH